MARRCPRSKSILLRNATHEDITGFIAAATATGSMLSGRTTLRVEFDHSALGHRPERRVVEDRVTDRPLRVADHGVDTRGQRQLTGARVVDPARL